MRWCSISAAVVMVAMNYSVSADNSCNAAEGVLTPQQIGFCWAQEDNAGAKGITVGMSADPEPVYLYAITFELNSAELTPTARAQLDNVAVAMNFPQYANRSVGLEGHTDASGSDSHNLALSQERASAVHDYLVGEHAIAPERMSATGYGETRPIPGLDPYADEQRRVGVKLE
ncbi:MAG: OmpA family protein [Pseudomonadota bacterium]